MAAVPAGGRSVLFLLYVTSVVVYALLQSFYARKHAQSRPWRPDPPRTGPSLDVVVPCYNEDPELLRACCESLAGQDYGPLNVYLVDDRSSNRDELLPVYRRYEGRDDWTFVQMERNRGKREAQNAAFVLGTGELVLTIDSDTVLHRSSIGHLVAELEGDKQIAAVTGNVRALNWGRNLLTRMINKRYRLLFEEERAAQGHHKTVLCCSGPLSLYRRSVLELVWKDYLNQRFLGQLCIFGDDLHLTNLLLSLGYESRYAPEARATTEVPSTPRSYFQQQVRWNRSLYRDLWRTATALWKRHPGPVAMLYLGIDVAAKCLVPLALPAALALATVDAVVAPRHLPNDLVMLAGMLATSATIVAWQTERQKILDPREQKDVLWFVVFYGFVHVVLLIPARLWALCTLRQNGWGTRELTQPPAIPQAAATVAA